MERIPRAEAKLLAMEELSSREGGFRYVGAFVEGVRLSDLLERSSATAADGCTAFSGDPSDDSVFCSGTTGLSDANFNISESLKCSCSRSFKVRMASLLLVPEAALENSPAARACSLMATVVFEPCVARAAALACSCACAVSATASSSLWCLHLPLPTEKPPYLDISRVLFTAQSGI